MHVAVTLQLVARLLAILISAAWVYKAVTVAFGLRRLPDLRSASANLTPPNAPGLVVIVPARNEGAAVGDCLRSLLAQDYPSLHIIAVDDRSTDATGAILDQLSAAAPLRLTSLHVAELPPGWLGKTHAMALAARHAIALYQPTWLLFTDGDVLFDPECLRRSLAAAELEHADHFVTLPTALVHTPGEGVILGFLQVIGVWATRLWKVADPRARDAMGIGAFNLLRVTAYNQIGGFEHLRLQIVEDLALARRIKQLGLRQRVAVAPGYVRLHWASGLRGVLDTMTKNLFAIFRYRLSLVVVGCAGLLLLCLGPVLGLLWSPTRTASLIGVIAIIALYWTVRPLSGLAVWNAAAFPFSAALFIFATLRSAIVTLRAGGVVWRGTFYPLSELRRQAERL